MNNSARSAIGVKMPRLLIIAGIIVALVGLYLGFSSNFFQKQSIPPKYTGPIEKITIGMVLALPIAPLWVAENKGYFQEVGLEPDLQEFDTGKTALKAMAEQGNLDIVTTAQTPVVLNSFDRNDYAIISGISYTDNDIKMLSRKDRGIVSPGDLKGKSIGVTKDTLGHFFLDSFLTHNGIKISEVKIIDLETKFLPSALAEGSVDAIAAGSDTISIAQSRLESNALLFSNKNIFRADFYFAANKTFISEHSDTIKRFLKAIDKGETFIAENREEAIEIVSKRLGITREATASLWSDYEFNLFLDQATLLTLEQQARWVIKNELTDKTKIPNYLDFIYFEALEKVKPEAVTIVR